MKSIVRSKFIYIKLTSFLICYLLESWNIILATCGKMVNTIWLGMLCGVAINFSVSEWYSISYVFSMSPRKSTWIELRESKGKLCRWIFWPKLSLTCFKCALADIAKVLRVLAQFHGIPACTPLRIFDNSIICRHNKHSNPYSNDVNKGTYIFYCVILKTVTQSSCFAKL